MPDNEDDRLATMEDPTTRYYTNAHKQLWKRVTTFDTFFGDGEEWISVFFTANHTHRQIDLDEARVINPEAFKQKP